MNKASAEIIDAEVESTSAEMVAVEPQGELMIVRAPDVVLEEAKLAAKALSDVIKKKEKPVIFNGEQYLEFEDWQTLGSFYDVAAKVVYSRYIEYGNAHGFESRAVAIRMATGIEISAAEAICLNDERNWANKPLFQLKSMAQTRACAKALRNILGRVSVLAGYKSTPAEDMDFSQNNGQVRPLPRRSEPQKTSSPPQPPPQNTEGDKLITEGQAKRLFAIAFKNDYTKEQIKDLLVGEFGYESTADIKLSDYDAIIKRFESQ